MEMCNIFRRNVTKDSVSRKSNTSKHILVNKSSKTGWDAASSSSVTFSTTGVSSVKGGEGAAVADCALSSPQICESNGGSLYMDLLAILDFLQWNVYDGRCGVGVYEWSRAEVLLCGIASTFHNITPIPICLRCQDDHQSVAAIKLSRKQMVYSRARSEKQNFLFSSQASLHSAQFPQSQSFGQEKAKHMCFCE